MEPIYCLICNLILMTSSADPHTLEYHFTTSYYPEAGRLSYQAAGHVDDVQTERYDSKNRKVELLHPWMREHINPQHWENHTQIAQYYERRQQEIIQDIMKDFNYTKGSNKVFVLQVRLWCLLSGDDSNGYEEFAANGNNFIILDPHLSEYIPVVSHATKMAKAWNRRKSSVEKQMWYMENECKMRFPIYLKHMKETLKPVQPKVKVWDRPQSKDVMRLQCLVYGFHPQLVDVKWVRNGEDHLLSDEMTPILPHPDGTYQIRVSAEVPIREGDTFSCHVDHSSLEEPLTVHLSQVDLEELKSEKWRSWHTSISIIIGAIFTFIGIMLIIKKRLSGRRHDENAGQAIIEAS